MLFPGNSKLYLLFFGHSQLGGFQIKGSIPGLTAGHLQIGTRPWTSSPDLLVLSLLGKVTQRISLKQETS